MPDKIKTFAAMGYRTLEDIFEGAVMAVEIKYRRMGMGSVPDIVTLAFFGGDTSPGQIRCANERLQPQ